MSKSACASVDDYIASYPPAVREVLGAVRSAIRNAVPNLTESIAYSMPAYKLDGNLVIYFAGWKRHYSLYPASPDVLNALKDDLTSYEVDNGTIRFPLDHPVPVQLIKRIVKLRAQHAGT